MCQSSSANDRVVENVFIAKRRRKINHSTLDYHVTNSQDGSNGQILNQTLTL